MDRTRGIGGSDLAAIVNYYTNSKIPAYKTALDVYHEKIGDAEKTPETWCMDFGKRIECIIADMYVDALRQSTSDTIEVKNAELEIVHPDYPYIRGTVDRWITRNNIQYILECKSANWRVAMKWGEEGSDDIPEAYLFQVAQYRMITGSPFVDIALYGGELPIKQYRYEKHEKLEKFLLKMQREFWECHVVPRVPPHVMQKSDVKYLETPVTDKLKIVTPDLMELVDQMRGFKLKIKEAEQQKEFLSVFIQEAMGDCEKALKENGKTLISNKQRVTKRLDTKRLKEEQPDLHEKYLKTTTSRPLLVY